MASPLPVGEGEGPFVNPLDLPFGKKPPKPEDLREKIPHFIGVKNEAVRDDAGAQKIITISVSGIKGVPAAAYKLEWVEGQMLGTYLSRLKLKRAAIYAAVRNIDDLERGRLRMTYIPEEGARISVGNSRVSSALQYQRTNHNAESVARNMGGGAKVVEVPLIGKGR